MELTINLSIVDVSAEPTVGPKYASRPYASKSVSQSVSNVNLYSEDSETLINGLNAQSCNVHNMSLGANVRWFCITYLPTQWAY